MELTNFSRNSSLPPSVPSLLEKLIQLQHHFSSWPSEDYLPISMIKPPFEAGRPSSLTFDYLFLLQCFILEDQIVFIRSVPKENYRRSHSSQRTSSVQTHTCTRTHALTNTFNRDGAIHLLAEI